MPASADDTVAELQRTSFVMDEIEKRLKANGKLSIDEQKAMRQRIYAETSNLLDAWKTLQIPLEIFCEALT